MEREGVKNNRGWKDSEIAKTLDISPRTIERVRQRLIEEGLEKAINPRPKPELKLRKIDGETEAHLMGLACFQAPQGYSQ